MIISHTGLTCCLTFLWMKNSDGVESHSIVLWSWTNIKLFLFTHRPYLCQRWIISCFLSSHQSQLSGGHAQAGSTSVGAGSWGSFCRPQCVEYATRGHHRSYKNSQWHVEEWRQTGETQLLIANKDIWKYLTVMCWKVMWNHVTCE